MGQYIISCCSTADLSKEHFEAIDVKYICFHYEMDGVQYSDDLGQSMPFDVFYARMSAGPIPKPRRSMWMNSSTISVHSWSRGWIFCM